MDTATTTAAGREREKGVAAGILSEADTVERACFGNGGISWPVMDDTYRTIDLPVA